MKHCLISILCPNRKTLKLLICYQGDIFQERMQYVSAKNKM